MVSFYKADRIGSISEDVEIIAEFVKMKPSEAPNIGEKIILDEEQYKIIERVFFVDQPNDEMNVEVFCKPCDLAEEWSD